MSNLEHDGCPHFGGKCPLDEAEASEPWEPTITESQDPLPHLQAPQAPGYELPSPEMTPRQLLLLVLLFCVIAVGSILHLFLSTDWEKVRDSLNPPTTSAAPCGRSRFVV